VHAQTGRVGRRQRSKRTWRIRSLVPGPRPRTTTGARMSRLVTCTTSSAFRPSSATTRALFAVAAAKDWVVHHVDVKTAFANAQIDKVWYNGAPYAPGGHRGDVGDDGGRGPRREVATPAAVVADGAATRGAGRGGGPADRLGPPGERTRSATLGTRAPREAGLARPRERWRAREGAAGDGRPGATRRVQRVARRTVSPPRL